MECYTICTNKFIINQLKPKKIMAQLEVKVVKDTEIRNLVCSPNTIVVAKQSTTTNAKTGAVTTNVRFIEVCKVKKRTL